MKNEYKVVAFLPVVKGCGAQDKGWDDERCEQFQAFLNTHAKDGWKLHSSEYRNVLMRGCGGNRGAQLVCIFER